MIVIHKIKTLYKNLLLIYGTYNSNIKEITVIIVSVFLLPIYFLLITVLSITSIFLFILFLPFYLSHMVMGYTWGMDDPIIGIVLLPFSISYYIFYIITFLPYLIIAFISDLIADLISWKNHNENYVIVWPSIFAAPHKEFEEMRKKQNIGRGY